MANGVSILAKPGQNTNTQALFRAPRRPRPLHDGERHRPSSGASTTRRRLVDAVREGVDCRTRPAAPPVTKTLSRTAHVNGIGAGATVPEWSRFIHDDATSCFTIDTVTIPGAVASRGPMCLVNGGNVAVNSTGAATTVGVGTNLSVDVPPVASSYMISAPTIVTNSWLTATNANLQSANDVYGTYAVAANRSERQSRCEGVLRQRPHSNHCDHSRRFTSRFSEREAP